VGFCFLLGIEDDHVTDFEFGEICLDCSRSVGELHQHIAGGAITLQKHPSHQFIDSQLSSVRILVPNWTGRRPANEIFLRHPYFLIELYLSGIDLLHHRHPDRKLVDALHRKVIARIKRNRLSGFEDNGGDSHLTLSG